MPFLNPVDILKNSAPRNSSDSVPKFSVVICTKDRIEDLADCLYYLTKQEFIDFEVVIVDGGGDTMVSDIAAKFGAVYVDQTKGGRKMNISSARNLGILNSKGQFVAFVDDDALPSPRWLTTLYSCYVRTDAAAVGGPVVVSRQSERAQLSHNHLLHAVLLTILHDDTYDVGRICKSGLVTENWDSVGRGVQQVDCLLGTNMSFSRDWLAKVGFFDEAISSLRDETDLCLRIVRKSGKILFAYDALVRHKVVAEGWPPKRQYKKYLDDFYFLAKHYRFFYPISFAIRETLFLLYLVALSVPFSPHWNAHKYALRGRIDAYRRFPLARG